MRIGVISRSNLDDRLYWSGVINSIYINLKKNKKIKVVRIDKLNNTLRKVSAIKREFIRYFKNKKYDENYNNIVSKNFAKQIESKIENKKLDFLLAFDSSLIANLNTKIPIILWTDLLYTDYYRHYYKKIKVSKDSLKSIKKIENKALNNCHKIILTSNWALSKAKEKYPDLSKKFKLLEFGPSFRFDYNKGFISKNIKARSTKKLQLITLSVNWERKGISKILSINKIINRKGIDSKLTIIGLKKKNIYDKNINIIKFINKNDKDGEKKISRHLLKHHFHLLLSNAEAYGIALVEANSRGLPNIAFKVGGMQHIIKNNINGKLFEQKSKLNIISDYIIKVFLDKVRYNKLSINSFDEYKKKYSYKHIISKFYELINK